MIEHNYQSIEGWFNMEKQYLELLDKCPEFGTFVELGAWKGKSTSFIVTEIINQGRQINFITVDTFKGAPETKDIREAEAYRQYNLNDVYIQYSNNTKHLQNYYATRVGDTAKAASEYADNSIDCIFIDAGHSYEAVLADLRAWYPKMKDTCIMAGHDYNKSWPGVINAVNEFFGGPDRVENDCWFKYIKKK